MCGLDSPSGEQLMGRDSVLQVRGLTPAMITVYQDDKDPSLPPVAALHNVQLIQDTKHARSRTGADNIAQHYKFTLSGMFERANAPDFGLLVEDDMVFSPDMFDFFRQLAPVLERDPSVWCISSWNDNGNKALVDKTQSAMIHRTSFFIGLGWLIRKTLYKEELESRWPQTHWDHWMREDQQRKGRECLYPELPRNHNEGIIGAHSDESLFNKYFRDIAFNSDLSPSLGDVYRFSRVRYNSNLQKQISNTLTVDDLTMLSTDEAPAHCVVYKGIEKGEVWSMENIWRPISLFFGLWHSIPLRGEHDGVLNFMYNGKRIFLIASDSPFSKYAKSSTGGPARVFTARDFAAGKGMMKPEQIQKKASMQQVVGEIGDSCSEVCLKKDLQCDDHFLPLVNSCAALEAVFDCKECKDSAGPDQPARIADAAPPGKQPGTCLVNQDPQYFRCEGKWEFAQRLCPCFPRVHA